MEQETKGQEIKKLFNEFKSKDNYFQMWMREIHSKDGWTFAATSHRFIAISDEKRPFDVEESQREPLSVARIIDNNPIQFYNVEIKVSSLDIEKYFDKPTKECDTCFGGGRVIWRFGEFTKLYPCPVCKGIGKVHDITNPPQELFYIDNGGRDGYYLLEHIKLLIKASEVIGEPIYLCTSPDRWGVTRFAVGDYIIMISPMCANPEENKIIYAYKTDYLQ